MLTVLFDGIAYGMLLFVISAGLAVTLGLMNFVNLAHGAFAMIGGYCAWLLVNFYGVPFFASLPIAFLVAAALGLLAERTLYVRFYDKSHLEQVLFTIGLVFMTSAVVDYFLGSQQRFINIPSYLEGQIDFFGVGIGRYRLLIIAICAAIVLLLHFILAYTRFGSRLRASVDDARVARGLGINVNYVFALTFAFGCGIAGLGGALGAQILSLEPHFPLKFMIFFLIVVSVGGTSGIGGPFLAALLLGIGDVAGKYYAPRTGGFVIYIIMIVVLVLRPQGLFARGTAK